MRTESTPANPSTTVVHRRIRAGCESNFEQLMQEFIAFVLPQPGHLSISVLRPAPGSSHYTVFNHFATVADRHQFTATPEYKVWMQRLREVSEEEPTIEELGGVAFWFTPDSSTGIRRPPSKRKMAALTLLGVYPLSMLLPMAIVPLTPTWPSLLRGLLIAALIVASLTWLVMPGLTHLFHRWLFPSDSQG
jgi:antibiotic biosynthesis monooxygenase (ABM) superfamily enzyme